MHTHSKIAILLLAINITACKQPGHVKGQPHAAGEPKYNAGQRLQTGARYYYNITNTTVVNFVVNGDKAENTNTVKARLFYEILKDTAGGFLVKMTFDNFDVEIKTPDSEKKMTTDNGPNSIDPVEKMLSLVKGSTLLVNINRKGQVTGVNGYKELTDKVMNGIALQNEADRRSMHDQMEEMFGEKFIRNNMEQGFGVLPDTAVYVGDSWTKKLTQLADIKLKINSTYTLASLKDNVAGIDATADINDTDSNVTLMGYQANVNLQGNEEGSYKADVNTGMLISGISEIFIKGTVQIQYRDVPLSIKEKKVITVKKI
jgi:uncharacterized protein DUF6263